MLKKNLWLSKVGKTNRNGIIQQKQGMVYPQNASMIKKLGNFFYEYLYFVAGLSGNLMLGVSFVFNKQTKTKQTTILFSIIQHYNIDIEPYAELDNFWTYLIGDEENMKIAFKIHNEPCNYLI